MNTINRYIRVYKAFLKINISQVAAYRMDALFGSIMASTCWSIFQITAMYLVTLHIKSAFGWTREELIMLSGVYSICVGFFSLVFMRAFSELAEIINRGWLDMYLMKPIDSQFTISVHSMSLTSGIRLILGVIIAMIVGVLVGIQPTASNILAFTALLMAGSLLLYSVLYIVATVLIWSPQLDNMVDLFYALRAIGRYPSGMYETAGLFVFLLAAPFALPISVPVKALLGTATQVEIIELVTLSMIAFIASRIFWKFALRSYTSASG